MQTSGHALVQVSSKNFWKFSTKLFGFLKRKLYKLGG